MNSVMRFKMEAFDKMLKRLDSFKRIICYTNGSCKPNPGFGGTGIAFVGLDQKDKTFCDSLVSPESLVHNQKDLMQDEYFLFGISLHLGQDCRNNQTEYIALILGIIFSKIGST